MLRSLTHPLCVSRHVAIGIPPRVRICAVAPRISSLARLPATSHGGTAIRRPARLWISAWLEGPSDRCGGAFLSSCGPCVFPVDAGPWACRLCARDGTRRGPAGERRAIRQHNWLPS
jgi:hypothetical protein